MQNSKPDLHGKRSIRLFLCGDVMLGRGIDQILPHPGNPRIHERLMRSATQYVELAETAHGPIPWPVDYAYIWGDTLDELDRMSVDARIVNLETSVTVSRDAAPKGIHYKINPLNIGALTTAKIDGCVLANNHVLDWGRSGLLETLETLRRAKILTVGAGLNADEAMSPAALELADSVRLLLFGFGLPSSGIPADWAATDTRPGINLLPDCSNRTLSRIAEQTRALARAGDVLVASLHWGANWGYDVPREQREFAHGLIESAGFTIIHGHSSHHPKAIEIHRGRPILYGCGDFITDYEGISGHEVYRSDLALMYLPRFELPDGVLVELRMIPFSNSQVSSRTG